MTQSHGSDPSYPTYPDATSSLPVTPSEGGASVYPPASSASRPAHQGQTPPPPTNSWHAPQGGAPVPPPPGAGYADAAIHTGYAAATPRDARVAPQEEKQWAMLSHLIPAVLFVLSAGTLGFLASLGIYLAYKDKGPFVRAHAANSLNLQIMAGIGLLVSALLMLVLIGFVTYPLVCIWALVLHVIGATRANNGQWWDPPMVPKLIR